MQTHIHVLPAACAGTERRLRSLHFGAGRSGRKAYIHAALHADEVPALLVAQHLRERLLMLEAQGQIDGEIVLVPMANPIGLSQEFQGAHLGRFDAGSGVNFNRGYRHLTAGLIEGVGTRLGADASTNTAVIRQAALTLLASLPPPATETEALKRLLQTLAADADTVLDLHCDHQAVVHVYAGTPLVEPARQLAARLGAQALLISRASGDDPFDEALSRIWWELAEHFEGRFPVAHACFAATVELRGETEVDDRLAAADAAALVDFLRDRGHVAGTPARLPPPACEPTPLEGVEPLSATASGILVFHKAPGDLVQAGEVVLEIVCPDTDRRSPVHATVSGRLFARVARRWAHRGMRVAKIAGAQAFRSGALLSP